MQGDFLVVRCFLELFQQLLKKVTVKHTKYSICD